MLRKLRHLKKNSWECVTIAKCAAGDVQRDAHKTNFSAISTFLVETSFPFYDLTNSIVEMMNVCAWHNISY
jgi:hypothetical protein